MLAMPTATSKVALAYAYRRTSPPQVQRVRQRRADTERVSVKSAYDTFKTAYRPDPAGFARDCIAWKRNEGLTTYQEEILTFLGQRRRASVRGPHGLGKTGLAAIAILWFALTHDGEDWKIATTASAWRQLTKFLWPEIHKWANRLRWDKIGRLPFDERIELHTLNLRLRTGEAFALASNNSALIEGAHADHLLYVFDEAKVIPPPTWDSAEGAFSVGDCYWLAISTPGEPQGRFYDIQRRKPGYEDWWVRHVTKDEAIAAGRVDADWAAARLRQWGEQSSVYINRVLGEFAAADEDGVIPLSWIEAANERWLDWQDAGGKLDRLDAIGLDVARFGEDKTVFALRQGKVIPELRVYAKEDTMATVGRLAGIQRAHGGKAWIDEIGVGAGVMDRAKELELDAEAFNSAERTDLLDRSGELGFADKRAAAYWTVRELLNPAYGEDIALPPDDELMGDLTAPKWSVQSGGKIRIEKKEDIRKRTGRSPDKGDGVVMSFWQEPEITGGEGFML